MRSPLIPFLIATAAVAASAVDNVSVAGKWTVQSSIAGNDSQLSCDFAQKDAELSGSCTSDRGNMPITGKVSGKKVTWSYKSEYNGAPLTVSYEGTAEPDSKKMTGTVTVPEYSVDGNFTATQAK